MYCPFCNFEETKVIDSRLVKEGNEVRRRRQCLQCHERYTTYEKAELALPKIIKRNGQRSPFDENKLRLGFSKALEKRTVDSESVENAINHLIQKLRAFGEREIQSRQLGEWVMTELRRLDDVAYVRFASVYRSFQDVNAFQEEINRLQHQQKTNTDD